MQLNQLTGRRMEAASHDSTAAEAAAVMRRQDIGFLPVIDGTRLVGVVTDRDLVVRGIDPGKDPDKVPLSEIMTPDVVTISCDAELPTAAEVMKNRQIRRLVLMGRDGHYEGVVTLGDLARVLDDDRVVCGTLRQIAQPA